MDMVAQWSLPGVILSIPLLFHVISHRKGKDKSVWIWVIMWCQAALVAFSTWYLYQQWHRVSALPGISALPDASDYQHFPTAWLGPQLALAAFLIVFPMAWYYRDRRKERIAAEIA